MTIDFTRFKKKAEIPLEPHPIKIYDGLTRSGRLNDLWRGQYLALEKWHELRSMDDLVVSLNTGGGKTVIGLLQGQSLVNETHGRVFYLCGSIQLIKQTAEAASSLGLCVATYYGGNFENEAEFNKGEVLCITTYQALFNGRSRMARDKIAGVIFDDAHVASHIVRDHFTIRLKEGEFPQTYSTLAATVKGYYEAIYSLQLFDQVVEQKNDSAVLFIPTFVWENVYKKVLEVLVREGVATSDSTKYSWEYLRDSLDMCAVFLTSQAIEITPFLPPVHLQSFMKKDTKKIFLSATVQNEPEFIRSFSFSPGERIAPETRAGESERLIVTPYVNSPLSDELFNHIIDLSKITKVLVISKSEGRASRWRHSETAFSGKDFALRVNEFKTAKFGLLVAPARFEGMDFPNDTCRVLVIDGLPSGTGFLEKFLWNSLGEVKFLQGTIASRMVQSLGRISRGNDDYGIVYLLGNDLADWITRRQNRERIPRYIRAQLELGERVSESLASIEDLTKLERAVLDRDTGWIELHQHEVKDASIKTVVKSDEKDSENKEGVTIAIAEREFIKNLWEREYRKAANALEPTLDVLFKNDKGLAAWHAHWIGFCYMKVGLKTTADSYFNRAAKSYKALGLLPNVNAELTPATLIPDKETQVGRILGVLSDRGEINYGSFSQMDGRIAVLSNAQNVSTNMYEEGLRWLGLYLGFQSNRPDNESGIGRGPDNFWLSDNHAIMIESKSEKTGKTPYSKKEVGQAFNHLGWIKEEYLETQISWKLMIAGPNVEADPAASPTPEMNVLLPEEIYALTLRIRNLLIDTWKEATPATLYSLLERNLVDAGLTHENIFNLMPERPIKKSSKLLQDGETK